MSNPFAGSDAVKSSWERPLATKQREHSFAADWFLDEEKSSAGSNGYESVFPASQTTDGSSQLGYGASSSQSTEQDRGASHRDGESHRHRRGDSSHSHSVRRHRSKTSTSSTSRQHSKRKHKKHRRPGITVDTSFATHKGAPPREIFPSRDASPVGRPTIWARAKSLRRTGKSIGSLHSRSHSKSKNTPVSEARPDREHAPEDHSKVPVVIGLEDMNPSTVSERSAKTLSPSQLQSLDISPSDRAILVGLAMPISASSLDNHKKAQEPTEHMQQPNTPTIIITPARPEDQNNANELHKPRPASSIYSRATFFYPSGGATQDNAPPVPALPLSKRTSGGFTTGPPPSSRRFSSKVFGDSRRTSIRDSAMTAFEEDDETPLRERAAPYGTDYDNEKSDQSQNANTGRGMHELTIDTTIPTPRRSRGWWNVITTPFESRSNPQWAKNAPTPDVPSLPEGAFWSDTTMTPNGEIYSPDPSHYQFKSAFSASTVTTMNTPWSAEARDDEFSPRRFSVDAPPVPPIVFLASIPEKNSQVDLHDPKAAVLDSPVAEKLTRNDSSASRVQAQIPVNGSPPLERMTVFPGANSFSPNRASQSTSAEMANAQALGAAAAAAMIAANEAAHRTPPVDTHFWTPQQPTLAPSTLPGHDRMVERSVERVFERNNSASARNPARPPPAYAPGGSNSPHVIEINNHTTFEAPPRRSNSSRAEPNKLKKKPPTIWERFFGPKDGKKRHKKEEKKRKKRLGICCCCCFSFLILVILAVVLSVVLTRKHGNSTTNTSTTTGTTPITTSPDAPSQWLNLTNYPPIPTGIATVAQVDAVSEVSGCVQPATLWSCAVPKEQQASISPNKPDQPNFRFLVQYNNETDGKSSSKKAVKATRAVPISALSFFRSHVLGIRDTSADLFTPSPAAPSLEDQSFIGNTTDKNSAPAEGENTPFFISLISPTQTITSPKARRAEPSGGSFSNITDIIPPPSVNSDGTAAAATLIPLPSAQPVRLYNRGQPDEHYGFYTYFDRSIFLKDISPTSSSFGGNPSDTNGGSSFDSATLRCTWAQTRFLVQIWTNSQSTKPLLPATATKSSTAASASATSQFSPNDFSRPGSFPYPVTITMDRHGGELEKKMIYCYGMDTKGRVNVTDKKFSLEDRSFGGVPVNPAAGPFSNVSVSTQDGGPGGIDGGTGGCQCQWQNWVGN